MASAVAVWRADPRFASVAEEERFWLAHDFDEAMETGSEAVTHEPRASTTVGRKERPGPRGAR
jgi:hypothetical protein